MRLDRGVLQCCIADAPADRPIRHYLKSNRQLPLLRPVNNDLRLSRPLADKWSSFCTFYNSCGPTEVTIVNTAEVHTADKEVLSIGRPTPNNTVYILNEKMEPCAIGEIGEMWAGGDCVSLGYIGNEELTNDRYVPDPFLGNGRMMFRTRDLGRWTDTGELEHFGRTDDQVKVRGFRVELDSVSAMLESVASAQ